MTVCVWVNVEVEYNVVVGSALDAPAWRAARERVGRLVVRKRAIWRGIERRRILSDLEVLRWCSESLVRSACDCTTRVECYLDSDPM